MFNDSHSCAFTTEKTIDEIHQVIKNNLQGIGQVKFLPNGAVRITTDEVNSFAYEAIIEGRLADKKNNNYFLSLESELKPSGIMWLLTISVVGLVMFILPYAGKNKLERKLSNAMRDIRIELN